MMGIVILTCSCFSNMKRRCLRQVLGGLTPEQQKAFLRFVTSCSRPPLLGFKYLDPALCMQVPVLALACSYHTPLNMCRAC